MEIFQKNKILLKNFILNQIGLELDDDMYSIDILDNGFDFDKLDIKANVKFNSVTPSYFKTTNILNADMFAEIYKRGYITFLFLFVRGCHMKLGCNKIA